MHKTHAGSSKKTAAYCTDLALKVRGEVGEKHSCKIQAVVTDSGKMEVKFKILREADHSLITFGC